MNLATILALATVFASPSIKTQDLTGSPVTLPVPNRVTVLLFVGTECPIANRTAPEFNRIVKAYRDVSFFFVYVDGGTKEDAIKHRREFAFQAPGILDAGYKVAKFAKATVTPEASVFDRQGNLAYHGRINDAYTEHNVPREKAAKNELRDAIEALLKGKKVAQPHVAAVGCAIPF